MRSRSFILPCNSGLALSLIKPTGAPILQMQSLSVSATCFSLHTGCSPRCPDFNPKQICITVAPPRPGAPSSPAAGASEKNVSAATHSLSLGAFATGNLDLKCFQKGQCTAPRQCWVVLPNVVWIFSSLAHPKQGFSVSTEGNICQSQFSTSVNLFTMH